MAHIVVVGLGLFGRTVAEELVQNGHQVIGIDTDPERVRDVAEVLTQAVTADATDEQVLQELGIANCDAAVVAIGENIEASSLTTLLLKDLKIPKVWAKAKDWNHHRILVHLHADRVIHPEYDVGCRTAQQLMHDGLDEYLEFGDDNLVFEVRAPASLVGKRTTELGGTHVLAHRRDNALMASTSIIQEADYLLVLGPRASLARFDSR